MQEKEGYVMNPKVKFSLMSFFSLAGFVGYIILLCNVKRIYAAGTAIGGFWVGLIACVILFDVLLHFAVRTGLEAFSGLKEAKDWDLVLPCCNTNGKEGYFPMQDAYDEGGYESQSSFFKAGVAEFLIEEGTRLLNDLHA